MADKRYRIYRNLRTGTYSIKDTNLDLIVAHCSGILLKDCKFVVNKSGKQRAIATKIRNVHAFIEGEIVRVFGLEQFKGRHIAMSDELCLQTPSMDCQGAKRVTYHPFQNSGFVDMDDNEIRVADYVQCAFDSEGKSVITVRNVE